MSSIKTTTMPQYKGAILGMVLILVIFFVLGNSILLNKVREASLEDFNRHAKDELELIGDFSLEPLLVYKFSDISQFVQKWSKSHPNVIQFKVITPKGFALTSFERKKTSPFVLSYSHKVTHAKEHLLTLEMVKDYSQIENTIEQMKSIFVVLSIVLALGLGSALWFIFRFFAVKPLQSLNESLDLRVKERTRELSSEKEKLLVSLRSIGDGVITTDIEGKIVLMNRVAEELTGWAKEEATGLPLEKVFRIINERTRNTCENPVQKVLKTGQIISLANHTALITKNGQEIAIADSGAPIRDNESNTVGVVLVFRDVRAEKRSAEEHLKIMKLESLGVLAGGIAHDFNNLLMAILGNISITLRDKRLEKKSETLLFEAEKACLRARGLTQQLLTFAKGGDPIKETSSLQEIIMDSAEFVLSGDKVSCDFSFPSDLWSAEIDKGQFSQVIQNLVLNASQATPSKGKIKIECSNLNPGQDAKSPLPKNLKQIKIQVKDKGVGIPPNILNKIFDPYFSTKDGGSGLGLSITHSIIRKHGGHILVESEMGYGTTFTVYLPASTSSSHEKISKFDETFSPPTKKLRILVMDDEEILRKILTTMIAELGHEAVLATTGEEALAIFKEQKDSIDFTIMDLTIPGGMGGEETVKHFLKINPVAIIAVSSGYSNDPIMANYKQYGFSAAIIKPFLLADLKELIDKLT